MALDQQTPTFADLITDVSELKRRFLEMLDDMPWDAETARALLRERLKEIAIATAYDPNKPEVSIGYMIPFVSDKLRSQNTIALSTATIVETERLKPFGHLVHPYLVERGVAGWDAKRKKAAYAATVLGCVIALRVQEVRAENKRYPTNYRWARCPVGTDYKYRNGYDPDGVVRPAAALDAIARTIGKSPRALNSYINNRTPVQETAALERALRLEPLTLSVQTT